MKLKNRSASSALAFLVADLAPGEAPDEIQLFPAGEFRARDGRPQDVPAWRLDESAAMSLITANSLRHTPMVIDYEHQSLAAAQNGQPAPAAGWFKNLTWRAGKGLYASVEWTARAREMIAAKEYRFISPVFAYAKDSGIVGWLFNAALTNNPALDGMDEVLARAAATYGFSIAAEAAPTADEDQAMKDQIIALLGLKAESDEDTVLAALKLRLEDPSPQPSPRKRGEGVNQEPDPAHYVKTEVVEALKTEIAELRTNQVGREVEEVIAAALNDERGPLLLEAQVEWARELGAKDLAALKSYLATAAPIAALRGRQTAGRKPPENGATALDDEQLAVLTNLGLTVEQISALKEAA